MLPELRKYTKEHPVIAGIITSFASVAAVLVALPGAILDVDKLATRFGGSTVGWAAGVLGLLVVIIVQAVIYTLRQGGDD